MTDSQTEAIRITRAHAVYLKSRSRNGLVDFRALQAAALTLVADLAERAVGLEATVNRLIEATERAIGEHNAPDDCYATGPHTGNPIADLIVCPACVALNEIAASRTKETKA
jgi:hypothetical protein